MAGLAVFALSWASMAYFLWVPDNTLDNMLIMLLLACTLAGNTALVGASRPMTAVGLIIYGGTLIALPLRKGGLVYDSLSVTAVFYVAYMAYLSHNLHMTARSMLELRDDKNDLIEALAKSKAESDDARMRAEEASHAKSEFLANMSHELRTPLNAVLGFSEMIHTGALGRDPDRHIEYARIIYDSGYHLLALINDILDLAKIEAGGLEFHEAQLDVRKLIAECLRLLPAEGKAADVTLTTEIAPGLPDLFADARALKQVFLNLISNAVKFTPPGGEVTVFAHLAEDEGLVLGVRDSGVGIAEADQAKVFEHFGQGRHDVVTGDKGTGLGLPIVKGLVEAHGGQVELTSAIGEGTCVTIRLPAERLRQAEQLRDTA